jgi:hypothetical protein
MFIDVGAVVSAANAPAGKGEPGTRTMRTILNILGILMILMGAIWFLQGINILPGSFMTGQIR